MAVNDYDAIFEEAGREWNVDPNLLRAMAKQESGGKSDAVSPKGARGVMQIMPPTGGDLGVTDFNDPAQSIFGGAKYMRQLLDKYRSPALALAAYNAGPQRVDDWQAGKGALPQETQAYVPAISANYAKMKKPQQPAAAPPPSAQGMSDDDFLKQYAAPKNANPTVSDEDFLKGVGAAPPAPPPPEPQPSGQVDDFGRPILVEPAPVATDQLTSNTGAVLNKVGDAVAGSQDKFDRDSASRANVVRNTVNAAVDTFNNTPNPLMTPQFQHQLEAAGPVGRFITSPLLQAGGAVIRGGAALGSGLSTAIGSGAEAAGVPALGRDINLGMQAAPLLHSQIGVPTPPEAPRPVLTPKAPEPYSATPQAVLETAGRNPLALPSNDVAPNPLARTQTSATSAPAFVPPGAKVPGEIIQRTRPAFVPPEPTPPAAPPAPEPQTAYVMGPNGSLVPAGTVYPGVGKAASPRAVVNDLNPMTRPPANDAEAYPPWNGPAPAAPTEPPRAAPTPPEPVASPSMKVPAQEPTPAPQGARSVGAAASRDLTAPEVIEAKTPAQAATDLRKSVTQTAAERAGPQNTDNEVYVPGVERTTAAREFSPENSRLEKTLRAQDPEFDKEMRAREQNNNDVMVDYYNHHAGDPNSLEAETEKLRDLAPDRQNVFRGQTPQDTQPLANKINRILQGPAGKQGAVQRSLNSVLNSLYDADGNLEVMPDMLYGVRKNITDMLNSKATDSMAADAKAARAQLTEVLDTLDPIIARGAPRFQQYLNDYANQAKIVDQQKFLQQQLIGSGKITDAQGNLRYNQVQKLLEKIAADRQKTGLSPAKSLTDEQIQALIAIRNELAAKAYKDELARAPGSDTRQVGYTAANIAKGIGKMAAAAAIKAPLSYATHGISNLIEHGAVRPVMEGIKANKAERNAQALKNRLRETTPPGNPLNP